MSTVPTDSVLRRHYEQMRPAARLGAESSRAPEPATPAPPAPEAVESVSPAIEPAQPVSPEAPPASGPAETPDPAPSRPAPSAPADSPQRGGGFIGWLRRLFGG